MKFTQLSALIGAVSANNFLQIKDEIINLPTDADAGGGNWNFNSQPPTDKTKKWQDLHKIENKVGEGFCQPHIGMRIWNLKPLDPPKSIDIITGSGFGDKNGFGMKLCETEFPSSDIKEHTLDDIKYTNQEKEDVSQKGNAYWLTFGSNDTLSPTFSFDAANFVPVKNADKEYTGWTLTYNSNQHCTDGTVAAINDPKDPPLEFKINCVCDKKAKTPVWSEHTYDPSACKASVTVTHYSGCVVFDGEAFFKAIEPYMGVIGILVGGIMTFAGAKFLFQLVAATIALVVTIIFYAIISNLFFSIKTGTGAKVGLMIGALVLGIGAAFLSYKFTRAWAIPIVAAGAGGMGFKLLLSLCGVRNEYIQIAGIIVGAALGLYVGKKFNVFVRTIGTAFLGSYILMRGCGFIFGGFPNEADDLKNVKANDMIVYYFLGFIVSFSAGSFVQWRLFHDEAHEVDKEDNFAGEDEGKKCGCF